MMRRLAIPVTVAMLLAAGWSGWSLWRVLAEPAVVPDAAPAPVALSAPAQPASRATGPVPAIFGPPLPPGRPAPRPAPEPVAPEPPEPPEPPLASLGYRLNGVVQADGTTWATLSHPAGERLVRTGDRLAPGIVVTRIDAEGVWVRRSDGAPELLGFPD